MEFTPQELFRLRHAKMKLKQQNNLKRERIANQVHVFCIFDCISCMDTLLTNISKSCLDSKMCNKLKNKAFRP